MNKKSGIKMSDIEEHYWLTYKDDCPWYPLPGKCNVDDCLYYKRCIIRKVEEDLNERKYDEVIYKKEV